MVIRVEGTIEAISPIHHGGDEKTGSTPVLRSITHWDPLQERHVRLPFISGNAIRGVLRRLVMRDLLGRLDIEVSPKLHHALFSGGVLEGSDEQFSTIDLGFRRSARAAVPPLGLFGCSISNQMIPGSLRVSHAMPVCAEYRAYLPEPLAADPRAQQPARSFTDVAFATRRDDLREERATDEQAVQMKIDFEAFVGGTLFAHGFALVEASDLEAACLGRAVELWAEQPYIGGKSSSGYGRVRLAYRDLPPSEPYLAYLAQEGDAIRAALSDLAGRLKG